VSVFLAVLSTFIPARAHSLQFPEDGNGLLDYCNHVVNLLDSTASQKGEEDAMKMRWCAGYIQATEERIENWRMSANIQIMAAQKSGKATPTPMWADEDFVRTCIPEGAPYGQMARVVVKWLREHPQRLHELKSSLIMEALRDGFPCHAH